MFLRKQSRKDFSGFIKAAKVETELLRETNKFLKNATNLNPLMKWYKRKFWYASPKGLLLNAEIRQVNIQIDQDGVHIQGYGTDGVTYDELAFFDKESAEDMAKLVAGTYISDLEHDRDFYKDMLKRTEDAIAYAKLPPKDKENAMLPPADKLENGFVGTASDEPKSFTKGSLLPKTQKQGTEQKRQLKKKAQ